MPPPLHRSSTVAACVWGHCRFCRAGARGRGRWRPVLPVGVEWSAEECRLRLLTQIDKRTQSPHLPQRGCAAGATSRAPLGRHHPGARPRLRPGLQVLQEPPVKQQRLQHLLQVDGLRLATGGHGRRGERGAGAEPGVAAGQGRRVADAEDHLRAAEAAAPRAAAAAAASHRPEAGILGRRALVVPSPGRLEAHVLEHNVEHLRQLRWRWRGRGRSLWRPWPRSQRGGLRSPPVHRAGRFICANLSPR
mmetsp:Transcript_64961/g.184297  ORF Transcript_64961/g.184297 Transcript_64961/m.184297 type:complete len:248 (-) Transcript_64961:547-1290(-)